MYRPVPAIQPCTLASTTGYRGINGGNWIQHKIVVNFIQQLVTGCTYWLHSLVHLLQQLVTECTDWLPAKQPCTVTSITGYSITDRLPASQPYTVASTGYSVPATQPCTLASTTGYRVYRLVLATQPCTLQQLATECTDWYWLHSLVHLLHSMGYKSTNRVLATQSLL